MSGDIFDHRMVVIGRESRGLTQKDLSLRSGISQAALSKIEIGLAGHVPDRTLDAISKALGYDPNFFALDVEIYGLGPSLVYHRKKQSLPIKTLKKVYARINIFSIQLRTLLLGVELEPCKIPRIDPEEYGGDIRKIARDIRSNWLPPGPVENLIRTIENAGGLVIFIDFETRLLDGVSLWPTRLPPLFFLNPSSPPDRLRWTLAHELGHQVLHQFPNSGMEKQADTFAAEMLIPAKEVKHSLGKLEFPKLADLKRRWKVSMAALAMQAIVLRKLPPAQQRLIWSRFTKAGFRRTEPNARAQDGRSSIVARDYRHSQKRIGVLGTSACSSCWNA